LGAGLEALARLGGQHAFGFSSLGAYAQERCHCAPRTADEARSLARRLEVLPQTRAAVLAGEIAWAMAVLVARVATPDDEAEWLSAARELTVRQRRERIREHREAQAASAEPEGAEPEGAEPEGANPEGANPEGAESARVDSKPDSVGGFHVQPPRMKTLTVTVDGIDALIFQVCALAGRTHGRRRVRRGRDGSVAG
jgi:hypothetical protein